MPNAGEIILDVRAKHDLLQGDLNKAKGAMAVTASAMERGLNTGGMMNAISMLGGMMPGLGGQISMVAGQMSQLGSILPNLATKMGLVGIAATAMAGELVAAGVAAAAIGTAGVRAAMSREDLVTAYTVLLKSKDAAEALIAQMQKLAARTQMETTDIANAGRKLMSYGFGIKEIIPTITALGDAAAVSGRGAEGLMALADAIGKVRSIGRLQGEELNRFTDAGVNPMAEIGKATGTSGGIDTRKLMESGEISAAIAIPAIMRAIDKQAHGAMEAMSKTLSGRLSTLRDDWNELMVAVGKPILPTLGDFLGMISGYITRIKEQYLPELQVRIRMIGDALQPVKDAFSRLWASATSVTLPDLLTRIKLTMQALSVPLSFVVDTFARLAAMIRNYFSGENPMTTFWVTFGVTLVPITLGVIKLIKVIETLRNTSISFTLIMEALTGNWKAIALGIAGAAVAGVAANLVIKKMNDDMERTSGMAKMEEDAKRLGRELDELAGNKAMDEVAARNTAAADESAAATASMARDAKIKEVMSKVDGLLNEKASKDAELNAVIKKRANEQADAVIAGLRKQFEAHQEYVNKLKAVYDRYVSSSAAVRSRMNGITVDHVGQRKQPEWDKYRDTLVAEKTTAMQYKYKAVPTREDTPRDIMRAIERIIDKLNKISNGTMPGVAT